MQWLAGVLLTFLYRTLLPDLAAWLATQVRRVIRGFRQEKATEKIEEDVREQKPRDEETREREKDYVNS